LLILIVAAWQPSPSCSLTSSPTYYPLCPPHISGSHKSFINILQLAVVAGNCARAIIAASHFPV